MDLTLRRPDLLDAEAWRAIEQHRDRLVTAISINDAPFVIGSAKELVECVARTAAAVKGVVNPSNADFAEVVNTAHIALDRQAGKGITQASDVRAIAQHAKKIVLSVKNVRNDFGTGHGRAEVKSIADEMVSLVVAGALLGVRWALTRLEHLILDAPENLIAELRRWGHAAITCRAPRCIGTA
ncbi:abortive infection family protein [Micromonospora sp. CPCC 205371]|nr:abortive infection family protein [Micromonospora sp. CPCC 205371]